MAKEEDDPVVGRHHWVLLLLALRDAAEPLDPVRVQSGMFILSHDPNLESDQRYAFELVDTGPFSSAVYSDLGELEESGLVDRHMVAGYTWSEFTATGAGVERAQSLVAGMSEPQLNALRQLADTKQQVLRLGFRDLMEYLVENYPMPARRSVLS